MVPLPERVDAGVSFVVVALEGDLWSNPQKKGPLTMIELSLAGMLLTLALAASTEPAKEPTPPQKEAAKPAEKAKTGAPAKVEDKAKPAEAPKPPKKASKEALADAKAALLGPCTPDMATGKVTKIAVIDGVKLNALIEKEKLERPRAFPTALFIDVAYENAGEPGSDYRQITTHHQLNTEQAQVLVGEKLCVFGKAQ